MPEPTIGTSNALELDAGQRTALARLIDHYVSTRWDFGRAAVVDERASAPYTQLAARIEQDGRPIHLDAQSLSVLEDVFDRSAFDFSVWLAPDELREVVESVYSVAEAGRREKVQTAPTNTVAFNRDDVEQATLPPELEQLRSLTSASFPAEGLAAAGGHAAAEASPASALGRAEAQHRGR